MRMVVDPSGCAAMMNTNADRRFYAWTALVFAVSLAATIYFCRTMSGGMEMHGNWTMSMMWMKMPEHTWPVSFGIFLLMWLAMMVAMMLPSAVPMLQNFREPLAAEGNIHAGIATALVACGYFIVWIAFGIVVYLIGVSYAFAAMRWQQISSVAPILAGALLIVAGVFQLTRWKMAALYHCRDPHCGMIEKHNQAWAAWIHGLQQGVFCGICCAGLMLALVALGAMNPFVMLIVAAAIAAEKLLPKPKPVVHITGILIIVAGIILVLSSIF